MLACTNNLNDPRGSIMKVIVAIAAGLSLSACAGVQIVPGGYAITQPDGRVCTHEGGVITCEFPPAVLAQMEKARIAQEQAKRDQQRAAQEEADKRAEADRAGAEAFAKTPEGIAKAAEEERQRELYQRTYEASQRDAAANDAAHHISIYKKMMADLRAQQKREYMVEQESGGVVDMNERYRIANDIVGLNEWINEAWKTYKANGGKAKSIDDIA